MPTFYETLDVPTDATTDQIKKQYKKLALKWHPDKNGNSEDSQERFKKIAQAYSVLSDDSQRRQYDAELRDASRRGFGGGGGGFGGGGFDVGGGSGGSRTSPPKPCPHCGGTCAPGTCPFAGSNPFDTRFNPNFNRSNRSSSDGRATRPFGESPFGAFPSFEDDFFARHRARAARSSRHTSGGGGGGGGGGFGKGADFGFLDAEAIFREFFGGRDPFETMLGGGSMLGGGGGRMSDGFGGGAFGSFGAMGAFDDFGASSGATVHVTRTVRDPNGTVHTTTYTTTGGGGGGGGGLAGRGATGRAALPPSESRRPASQYTSFSSALHSGRNSTRTSDAVSGGAVSGASRTSGGGRPSERRAVGDGGDVRPSERRVGRDGGGGILGGVDEDEQLAADLAEAIRISRDLSLDDEERMMQAAIRASLGH